MLFIRKKTVANYALLRCKTFSLKIWVCKIFDKFHVCLRRNQASVSNVSHCLQRTRTTTKVPRLMATGSWANLALAASAGQIPA